MKLNLKKDLVVFDLETTGLSITKCKIIQIAIYKIFADGHPSEMKKRYINPECSIPEEVVEITGITDEMVKDAPTFKRVAKGIFDFIGDSDVVTYNGNRFDIPILIEHFYSCGLEFDMDGRNLIDVKRLYHKMEPRDLSAAYKFYCGKKIEGAHDAGNDCIATAEVLESMLDKYKGVDYVDKHDVVSPAPIKNDMTELHNFTKDYDSIDFSGTLKYNKNGIPVFGFGKYQGQPVAESLIADPKYLDWIMNKGEFARDTKKIIDAIISDYKIIKSI